MPVQWVKVSAWKLVSSHEDTSRIVTVAALLGLSDLADAIAPGEDIDPAGVVGVSVAARDAVESQPGSPSPLA